MKKNTFCIVFCQIVFSCQPCVDIFHQTVVSCFRWNRARWVVFLICLSFLLFSHGFSGAFLCLFSNLSCSGNKAIFYLYAQMLGRTSWDFLFPALSLCFLFSFFLSISLSLSHSLVLNMCGALTYFHTLPINYLPSSLNLFPLGLFNLFFSEL